MTIPRYSAETLLFSLLTAEQQKQDLETKVLETTADKNLGKYTPENVDPAIHTTYMGRDKQVDYNPNPNGRTVATRFKGRPNIKYIIETMRKEEGKCMQS